MDITILKVVDSYVLIVRCRPVDVSYMSRQSGKQRVVFLVILVFCVLLIFQVSAIFINLKACLINR